MSGQVLSILFDRYPAADAMQLHIPVYIFVVLILGTLVE